MSRTIVQDRNVPAGVLHRALLGTEGLLLRPYHGFAHIYIIMSAIDCVAVRFLERVVSVPELFDFR